MSDTPKTDAACAKLAQNTGDLGFRDLAILHELCKKIERENARLRKAAMAVIMPLIQATEVHPCDEMNMEIKAKACPYGVYELYRLCLPNVASEGQREERA